MQRSSTKLTRRRRHSHGTRRVLRGTLRAEDYSQRTREKRTSIIDRCSVPPPLTHAADCASRPERSAASLAATPGCCASPSIVYDRPLDVGPNAMTVAEMPRRAAETAGEPQALYLGKSRSRCGWILGQMWLRSRGRCGSVPGQVVRAAS